MGSQVHGAVNYEVAFIFPLFFDYPTDSTTGRSKDLNHEHRKSNEKGEINFVLQISASDFNIFTPPLL
jgi:hypothetical protein